MYRYEIAWLLDIAAVTLDKFHSDTSIEYPVSLLWDFVRTYHKEIHLFITCLTFSIPYIIFDQACGILLWLFMCLGFWG